MNSLWRLALGHWQSTVSVSLYLINQRLTVKKVKAFTLFGVWKALKA
jgi:hypothetical protein